MVFAMIYTSSFLTFVKNFMCCNSFSAQVINISWREGMVYFAELLLKSEEIYTKAFWHSTKASLLQSWPLRVGWGRWKWNAYLIGEIYFYMGQGYSGHQCGPWASCLSMLPSTSPTLKWYFSLCNMNFFFQNFNICMVVNGINQESVRVIWPYIYLVKRICRWQYMYWSMHQNFVKMQDNYLVVFK
jgi:hypothetical protein